MRKSLVSVLILFGLVACTNASSDLVLPPTITGDKIVADTGIEVFDPSVDILFVIDNSGSMQQHQANLSKNINRFIQNFVKKSGLDFHIGVLTTDMESATGRVRCCGQLTGNPIFVQRNTPNFNTVLSANMIVGTNGSAEEHSFDPVMEALSEPTLSRYNAGFYRTKSHLAIIFVTDAEDQSQVGVQNFYKFLLGLKGDAARVSVYGVIVPSSDRNCDRDSPMETPDRIESLLAMVSNAGNNVMSLCSPDYGDKLASLGDDLLKRVGSVIFLNRRPVSASIRVQFGSQNIPSDPDAGFMYDSFKNSIILGEKIVWSVQPAGTQVQVYYEAAIEE